MLLVDSLLKYVASAKFISTLLRQIYLEQSCVYFLDGGEIVPLLLSQSLLKTNLQILNINWRLFRGSNIKVCSGYILTTKNLSKTYEALGEEFENNGKIFPYERMIIFSDSLNDKKIFDPIIDSYALDIIMIEVNAGEVHAKHISNLNSDAIEPSTWIPKKTFYVSAFHCTPFFYINEKDNILGGFEFQFIETALQNFAHSYKILNESSLVKDQDNWQMVRETVAQKETDLAGCSPWHASLNFSLVDATYPLRQNCLTALVPKPQLLPSYTFILQPFSLVLWLAIFFILFIFVLVLSQATKIYKIIGKSYFYKKDYAIIMIDLLRLLSLGGLRKMPYSNQYTFRIIFLMWLVVCVYNSTYYSAGITSSLSNPKVTRVITTLDDMVNYNIRWDEIPFLKDSFEKSDSQVLKKLATLSTQILDKNVAKFTKQICNFYLTDTESLDSNQRQSLTVLKECFGSYYVVFVVKKHSPFTKILNKHEARLFEQGILDFWLKNISYFEHSNSFFKSLYSDFGDNINIFIDLNRLMGAFYMLLVGHFVAFLVFMLENFVRKKNK